MPTLSKNNENIQSLNVFSALYMCHSRRESFFMNSPSLATICDVLAEHFGSNATYKQNLNGFQQLLKTNGNLADCPNSEQYLFGTLAAWRFF